MTITTLSRSAPGAMTPAQSAAGSYLARYAGPTHTLYTAQLRRWFTWFEANGLDPLAGIHRAHVELYICHLQDIGLRDSRSTRCSMVSAGSSGSRTSTV